MDRSEIKRLAKEKIKGNKWNILWPLLIIMAISNILSGFMGPKINIEVNDITTLNQVLEQIQNSNISATAYVGSSVVSIIIAIITAGYLKYLLNFVRTGKFDTDEIINTIKTKWIELLIANILSTLIIGACTVLFIIPGIIATFALAMINYLIIDRDVKGSESLKESNEMMKGYKWDYFVFCLSFIGWYLLVPFTLGLILIWLVPYEKVSKAIYYDKLSAKKN